MSGSWPVVLIALSLAVALVRLWLWRRASSLPVQPLWRFPALVGLNVAAAVLLALTLAPPGVGPRSGRLIVLTAGAADPVELRAGDVVVALPESAPGVADRAPDLATALRRHPELHSIQILGAGLTARDRAAVDRPLAYDPPTPPAGVVALTLPDPVAAGAPFSVGGAIGSLDAGVVELVDPAGAVVDQATVASGRRFALTANTRAAGLALFDLRLRDSNGRVVESLGVPVEARAPAPPRVSVLAGAPGPEPRFLRRWAEEAGIDLQVSLALGAGVDLSARAAPVTPRALADLDLLVIDERRWEGLSGGERAAVRSAVAGGLGLLLRPTGPLSAAVRRDWAALGVSLSGGETLRPLILDENDAEDVDAGPGPELSRRDFAGVGNGAVVLIAEADGTPLAAWRPYGAGRVGVWVVADSFALALSGRDDRYGALWSRMFSALARPDGPAAPRLARVARAGERATVCAAADGDVIAAPAGGRSRLLIDPRAGPGDCAAFWPTVPGWHAVTNGEDERGVVYIHPAEAAASLRAAETRAATLALAQNPATERRAITPSRRAGSPWLWWFALVICLAALWWLERRRPQPGLADGA